jgi:hypothetical protein
MNIRTGIRNLERPLQALLHVRAILPMTKAAHEKWFPLADHYQGCAFHRPQEY